LQQQELDEMLATINPEIYQRFQTAIELGKWPDGVMVEPQQMELLLQVTIAYGAKNGLNESELFKVDSMGKFQDGKIIRQQASTPSRMIADNEIPIIQKKNNN
jgi:hypothetical protein